MAKFFEFFAGGGMARAGLGKKWTCLFANDFDDMKGTVYANNWGRAHLVVDDVNALTSANLPGEADLAWASFPCQDLSLAGNYAGIGAESAQTRSGAFWGFWKLMTALRHEERAPPLIVLENVYGILTANSGADFAAIGEVLVGGGYRFGALLIDGARFVPQSRPRVFIVGVRNDLAIPDALVSTVRDPAWHPEAMAAAVAGLSSDARNAWLWWTLPLPKKLPKRFSQIIEDEPKGVAWHSPAETLRIIGMMSPRHIQMMESMKAIGTRAVGTIYKRTRRDADGNRMQRAELRFDDVAGCLRTPGGGSSRQSILVVEGESVRSRLLSPREAARLMGLPEKYKLPAKYNDAYHVAGDGLVVPAVRHLAAHLLEPLLAAKPAMDETAYAMAAE